MKIKFTPPPSLRLRARRVMSALALVLVGMLGLATLSACGYNVADRDRIGLYYNVGWQEGDQFDHVILPGVSDDTFAWNDTVTWLPNNLRTWRISTDGKGDDVEPICVAASDQNVVCFQLTANFKLNTNSDDIKDFKGGTVRKFNENVCKRYTCESDEGWMNMLRATVKPSLSASFKDIVRAYKADDLVYNNQVPVLNASGSPVGDTKSPALSQVQAATSSLFLAYLERLVGGSKYFCGPTFERGVEGFTCPPIELVITDVDFQNPEVQKARESIKVATDRATAQKIEAEGALAAQKAFGSPAEYIAYLQAQALLKQAEASVACANSDKCTFIGGGAAATVPAK